MNNALGVALVPVVFATVNQTSLVQPVSVTGEIV